MNLLNSLKINKMKTFLSFTLILTRSLMIMFNKNNKDIHKNNLTWKIVAFMFHYKQKEIKKMSLLDRNDNLLKFKS